MAQTRSPIGTFVRFFGVGYTIGRLVGDRRTGIRTGLVMGTVAAIGQRTLLSDANPGGSRDHRVVTAADS